MNGEIVTIQVKYQTTFIILDYILRKIYLTDVASRNVFIL